MMMAQKLESPKEELLKKYQDFSKANDEWKQVQLKMLKLKSALLSLAQKVGDLYQAREEALEEYNEASKRYLT
jgi:hypothetical protein